MFQTLVESNLSRVSSTALGFGAGAATFWDYAPKVAGTLASVAAFVWIVIQAYFYIKDRRKK
jgi:hypothetical protein